MSALALVEPLVGTFLSSPSRSACRSEGCEKTPSVGRKTCEACRKQAIRRRQALAAKRHGACKVPVTEATLIDRLDAELDRRNPERAAARKRRPRFTDDELFLMAEFGRGVIGPTQAKGIRECEVPHCRGFGVSPQMRRRAALAAFRSQRVAA